MVNKLKHLILTDSIDDTNLKDVVQKYLSVFELLNKTFPSLLHSTETSPECLPLVSLKL